MTKIKRVPYICAGNFDPFHLEEEEYNKILKRIEEGVIKTIKRIIEINKSYPY